jgi:hypothetical protein
MYVFVCNLYVICFDGQRKSSIKKTLRNGQWSYLIVIVDLMDQRLVVSALSSKAISKDYKCPQYK